VLLLCLWFPICEELMFRALAFGQLYRRARWGFWPSALAPAMAFALLHALQGASLAEMAGLAAITGLGAVIFAYFFLRFGWNLWGAVSLHAFLNLWWELFTANENALGGWSDNVFRFGSIGLAFALILAAGRRPALRWLVPARRKAG
jgi:membrane protease YdiL (CAAX protease family)